MIDGWGGVVARERGETQWVARTRRGWLAGAADDGLIDLRTAIYTHLRFNFYPPLPESLVDTAMRALTKANRGEWERKVRLPVGATYKGKRDMRVGDVLDWLRLETFLEVDEYAQADE